MSKQNKTCPCGSNVDFIFCCGRYISGEQYPPTAEALMRSRYSAYVVGDEKYLLNTWHSTTRPTELALKDDTATKWIGLDIKSTGQGTELDEQGTVEFVARYKINGKAQRLHETSEFRKEQDKWFYLDGVIEP
jgi:SEC-C motif-containing protein